MFILIYNNIYYYYYYLIFLYYRLSGSAAIKSKNVCLQLVDNHTSLTNSGIVQLFTQPHPQKIIPSPYWCKIPPRLRSSFLINKYSMFNIKFLIFCEIILFLFDINQIIYYRK